MSKILVKTRKKIYIREGTNENSGNILEVHPNKIRAWANFSRAAQKAYGGTMEDVIQSVIDELKGTTIKAPKPKVKVSEQDYQDLLVQAINKGISNPKKHLEMLVEIVEKEKTEDERLEELIRR